MTESATIESTFVVINPALQAEGVAVTNTLFSELEQQYDNFKGHMLISSFSFDEDWPTWEMHPHGDEFVCLLSGDVELLLRGPAGEQKVRLRSPGSFVIVPKNTWHKAKVNSPAKMIFVTPGQGTENRESPP
ncbi:MAG: cupin domain-containing protein [Woeseiaceae bacterium]